MSRDISPDVRAIRLFLTEPHPCSYLEDQKAITAFVDPSISIDKNLYTYLSRHGFRRSGRYIYAPRCKVCQACIPARLVVDEFAPNRQQHRCNKRNTDLTVSIVRSIDEAEHYPLYEHYLEARHADGDMYPPTMAQYRDFISSLWENSRILEIRLHGKLIAAGVIDILNDGLSAIYTYYSPDYPKRSLGTYMILAELVLARDMGLPYLYLGYWIERSPKMSYKKNFQPLELFIDDCWVPMN